MTKVTNGYARHRKHQKLIGQAKGFRLGRSTVYKQVKLALIKQGQHAYKGRKLKKRQFRTLRIERLNAAARMHGMNYATFVGKLRTNNITLDRKILSHIAVSFPQIFEKLCSELK